MVLGVLGMMGRQHAALVDEIGRNGRVLAKGGEDLLFGRWDRAGQAALGEPVETVEAPAVEQLVDAQRPAAAAG